jgi:glycosyltransferase involved in cell wall biosynthesis
MQAAQPAPAMTLASEAGVPPARYERAAGRAVACIVSNSFDKDPRAQKVVASIANLGLRVTVLAWHRESSQPSDHHPYAYSVLRFGPRAEPGRGLRQLPALLIFWLRVIKVLVGNDFAAYHCNRFDTLVPAMFAYLFRRRPIVYDLHTSYADRLHIHNRQPGMKLVRRVVAIAEDFAIRRVAAHCFTDSAAFTETLKLRGARSASTLLNLPRRDFDRNLENRTTREGPLIVGRIGAFSAQLGQGAEDLLYILRRNDEEDRPLDLRLLLLGNFVPASYRLEITKQAADPRITIRDYVPHSQVSMWYKRLDIAVITYDITGGARYSRLASAQKVFEAMAAGVPMVLLSNPYMERLVQEIGCGVVPEQRGFEGIYQAVLHLARDPDLRARMGDAGQQAFVQRYNWEHEEIELHRVYRRLLTAEPQPSATH